MNAQDNVEQCGWCGTPLDADPWCDHCLEERDRVHERNLAEVDKARRVLQLHRLVPRQRRRTTDD